MRACTLSPFLSSLGRKSKIAEAQALPVPDSFNAHASIALGKLDLTYLYSAVDSHLAVQGAEYGSRKSVATGVDDAQ